jgi:tetratricopeptide (TPR) repeat protein
MRAVGSTAAVLAILAVTGGCRRERGDAPDRPASPIVIKTGREGLLPVALPAWKDLDEVARQGILPRETRLAEAVAGRDAGGAGLVAAYGDLGKAYHAFGLHRFAIPCFENARTLEPRAFRWHYYLARAQWFVNERDRAREALERALALEPRNLASLLFLAQMHRAAERREPARAAYAAALAVDPECALAHVGLAEVAVLDEDFPLAITHYEEALRLQPSSTRNHYQLALAYRRVGNAAKAQHHMELRGEGNTAPPPDALMEEIVSLNPRTFARRGVGSLRAGRAEEAVAQLKVAVERSPRDPAYRLQLGMGLSALGRPAEAITEYREALRLKPDDSRVYHQLGVAAGALGHSKEAVTALARAVELDPGSGDARLALAQALRRQHRDSEALSQLDEAVRLDPSLVPPRMARARVLAGLGRCKDAVASAEAGLGVFPGDGSLTSTLAILLAACPDPTVRDPARAVRLAREAFSAEATVDHATMLALAFAARGDWTEAEAWQRRALTLLGEDRPRVRAALAQRLEAYQAKRMPAVEW